ncbi:MAG TPA: DUF3179 domain-containing (seleno)protein [Flavobacteriales bacterium]|nr:DUF3179 domain-containing protein [Flavobacteriales bacterium]HQW85930.1 DUF3179 domain-containing (seleno)protein [Flavobacteriales bacterium]
MRLLSFLFGLLLLIVPEVLRVYTIMPFPGSQEGVATDLRQVDLAYWLHHHVWWLRLLGLAFVVGPALHTLRTGGWLKRIGVLVPLALAATVFYLFNFKFMADRMFLPVEHKVMAPVADDGGAPNDLVIAVERHGEVRAYPIELIGYHHQVLDTIGGEAVMVTYCTVCRTGRTYSPVVNGQPETFRLVGMDHFNAMFEDGRTGSWWRQATGECIAGPLKGQVLPEVPSTQLTRAEFARLHPQGLVMQPDPAFMKEYAGLKDYDEGTMVSSLEGRDTASWQPKSWVVGVVHNGVARAYDWNELQRFRVIKDLLGTDTISVALANDQRSFSAYVVHRDTAATSQYEANGDITARYVVHVRADTIPAYQEYWHSWRTFHPNTTRYGEHD